MFKIRNIFLAIIFFASSYSNGLSKEKAELKSFLLKKYKDQLSKIVAPGIESILLGAKIYIKELKGHTRRVTSVAISPDAQYALSGSIDETARLWDITNLNNITFKELKGHTSGLTAVTFSPDSKYALTGSWDGTAKIWDLKSSKIKTNFKGHSDYIMAVAFSPNANEILTGSRDYTARLWNVATTRSKELTDDSGYVTAVGFSDDGKYAVTRSSEGVLKIWDIGDSGDLREVDIKNNNLDKKLWELENLKNKILKEGEEKITTVALSADGKYILSGDMRGNIMLQKVKDSKDSVRFNLRRGYISAVAFSPNQRVAIIGAFENSVLLWEFNRSWIFNDLDIKQLVFVINLLETDPDSATREKIKSMLQS